MANNRMMLVCNKCYPTDEDIKWEPITYQTDVAYIGKWYPVGSYVSKDDAILGQTINEYLDKHSHEDDIAPTFSEDPMVQAHFIHNENPVRLTYETWVKDMPAIKKWEPTHE